MEQTRLRTFIDWALLALATAAGGAILGAGLLLSAALQGA